MVMGRIAKWYYAHGRRGGDGKVAVQDLSFTHFLDKASANLWKSCANGKHIPEAVLTCRKAGENPLEYLIITMKTVIISSVSTGGSGGEDRLTENCSLNFAEFELKYQPQDDKGAKDGGEITAAYDIAKNVAG